MNNSARSLHLHYNFITVQDHCIYIIVSMFCVGDYQTELCYSFHVDKFSNKICHKKRLLFSHFVKGHAA